MFSTSETENNFFFGFIFFCTKENLISLRFNLPSYRNYKIYNLYFELYFQNLSTYLLFDWRKDGRKINSKSSKSNDTEILKKVIVQYQLNTDWLYTYSTYTEKSRASHIDYTLMIFSIRINSQKTSFKFSCIIFISL